MKDGRNNRRDSGGDRVSAPVCNLETDERKVRYGKLDKVIAGLECCQRSGSIDKPCVKCPYEEYEIYCMDVMRKDALDLLKKLTEDLTGAQNEIHALLKKQDVLRAELAEERERSARWLRESEPVVHAHWVIRDSDEDSSLCECSACREWHTFYGGEYLPKRCPECGAHMDEEVAE